MSHVFISYSREDAICAGKVASKLAVSGYSFWQDVKRLRGGDNMLQRIFTAIEEADAFVVVWSENSQKSEWVKREVIKALEVQATRKQQGKPFKVIPYKIDETPITAPLPTTDDAELVYIGASECDPYSLTELIQALPEGTRSKESAFSAKETLAEQGAQPIEDLEPLVQLPFLQSHNCKLYVVGEPDAIATQITTIQLVLYFSRRKYQSPLPDVVKTVQATGGAVFGLYAIGPLDAESESYKLADDSPAQWLEAIYAIEKSLARFTKKKGDRPTAQVFAQAPNALTFALGLKLDRFYTVELFNWTGGDVPYSKVLESKTLLSR